MQGRHERLCGLYFLKDDDVNRAEVERVVPLTQVSINVNTVDSLARVKIKQVYTSDKKSVSPAGVCLPLIEYGASSFSIVFLVNGKEATPRPFRNFKYQQSRSSHAAPNELYVAKLLFCLLPDIPPGKTVEIRICYMVSMHCVAGVFHLRVPRVAVNVLENDAKKRKKLSKSFHAPVLLKLAAEAMSPIKDITVAGEKVDVSHSATRAAIHCKRTQPVSDVLVSIAVNDPMAPASYFLPHPDEGGPAVCLVAATPNGFNSRPYQTEVILMIDNSVSVKESGALASIKKLAVQLLKKLPADVFFNVAAFGGDFTDLCFPSSMEKSKKPIAKATKFINGLKGSAIESDFAATLEKLQDIDPPKDCARQIVMLSDFLINISSGHLEFISELAKEKWSRFFCVGVGQAAFRGASRVALCGRGLYTLCELSESKLCSAKLERIVEGVIQPPTSMVSVKHKDSSIGMLSDATAVDAAFEGTRMHRFFLLPENGSPPEGAVGFFFGEGSCTVNFSSLAHHDPHDSDLLRNLYGFYALELLLRGDKPRKDWSARRVNTSREFGILSKYHNIILTVEQEKQRILDAKKPRPPSNWGSNRGQGKRPPKKAQGVPQRALPPGIDSPPGTWPLPQPAAESNQLTHAERQAFWINARKKEHEKIKGAGATDNTVRYNEMEGVFIEVGLKHLAELLQVPPDQIDHKRIHNFRRVIDLEIKKFRQESFGAPSPTIERSDLIARIENAVSDLVDVAGHNMLKQLSVTSTSSIRGPTASNPLMVSAFSLSGMRDYQEDRYVLLPNFNNLMGIKSLENAFFCGIYDGHDGFQASEYCKTHLHVGFKRHLFLRKGAVEEALSDAFVQADVDFREIASGKNWSSGATATVVVIDGNVLYQANVGDGEAFIRRGGKIEPLTEKHNPGTPAEIERLKSVNAPLIDLRNGKFRVGGEDGMLGVSRSIGDPKYNPEHVISVPFVKRVELVDAEFVVLASDGLWDVLTFEEVATMVEAMKSTEQMRSAAEFLVKEALQRKSQDNITAVVLFFKGFLTISKALK